VRQSNFKGGNLHDWFKLIKGFSYKNSLSALKSSFFQEKSVQNWLKYSKKKRNDMPSIR